MTLPDGALGRWQRRAARPVRLTDEAIEGRSRPAAWVNATVAGALAVDHFLAAARLARPVLLVSGFWRSGTTWLQECLAESLGAKTVFEPLSPMDPRRRVMLGSAFASEDECQAFVPGPDQDVPFWRLLDEGFRGAYGSRFTLSCRRGVRDSLRTTIVVKDVRLHRNLRAVHDRFALPVVHVRRHPCAVVASLRAAQWHWGFERVALRRAALPAEDPEVIAACDGDGVSRLAAFWALQEREAAAALRDQPWAIETTYEALVLNPGKTVETVCAKLGLHAVRVAESGRPSASLDPRAFSTVAARRSDFWRDVLTGAEIARIEEVASMIFPRWTTWWRG